MGDACVEDLHERRQRNRDRNDRRVSFWLLDVRPGRDRIGRIHRSLTLGSPKTVRSVSTARAGEGQPD